MNKIARILVAVFLFTTPALAGIIKVDLDGSGTGTFFGIGSANVTYSDTVQIQNQITGATDNFQLVLRLTGSGPITLAATGIGIGDANIDDGESLKMQVELTPASGTTSGITDFQFDELGHGITHSDFPTSFVAVSDGATTNILANGTPGPATISNLDGETVTVSASTAPFAPGSVNGVSSISFEATAVPEPSSFFMCGLLVGRISLRRKRRSRRCS